MLLLPGVGRRAEPAARIPEEAVVEVPDVPEPAGEVAAEEQAANAWRQAVKGAWEQSDEPLLLGLQPAAAEVGMAGSDPQAAANTDPDQGFKVKIKNTFIDVEEENNELSKRGAQTAMARLAGSKEPEFGAEHYATQDGHVYMSKKIISEHGYGRGGLDPKAPSWEPRAPTPSTCLPGSLSDSGVPTTILGKELTFDSQEDSLKSSPQSDRAPSSPPDAQAFSPTVSPPMAPPPPYAAPETFEEAPTSQPPPTPPGSNQANGEDSDKAKYIVKNTFIEIETDTTPQDQRFTQSCLARFSSPLTPQFWTSGGSMLPPTPSAQKMETVHEALLEPPSLGSEVHGKFSEDGQPVCQPCAWFYKESGCRNASSCRYCHLCPQGELKNRKKAKIARLRNQEAAATTSPKSASSPASTPAKNDKDVAAVSLSNNTTPVNAAS